MIEHEFKYVLSMDAPGSLLKTVAQASSRLQKMEQKYISQDCRIRKSSEDGKDDHHQFTFKKKTKQGTVEIETTIESRYYDMLSKPVELVIQKDRYDVTHDGLIWEVDFFYDRKGRIYFIMAEVEMPEGAARPTSLPPCISSSLIHTVAYGDKRFSSKSCLSPTIMAELLKRIKNGKL